MKKIIFGLLVLAVGLGSIFAFQKQKQEFRPNEGRYEIVKKWELPEVLNEISGIAWVGNNSIACVQDEDGIIFVYNLNTSEIENRISFGDGGDYEGITVIEDDAYVLRSDGIIYEVLNFRGSKPQVNKHVTSTNRLPGINLEGLAADPKNNRLLLAVKERKEQLKYKEIFSFNLTNKTSEENPVFKIDLSNPIFEEVEGKLKKKFTPGEMGILPKTGEHYILDGSKPKLLITEKDGTPKELFMLSTKDFGNPEGLTFSSDGTLYISNEAEDAPANILQVTLHRK